MNKTRFFFHHIIYRIRKNESIVVNIKPVEIAILKIVKNELKIIVNFIPREIPYLITS